VSESKNVSGPPPVSVSIRINLPVNLYNVLKKRCEEVGLDISTCVAKAIVEVIEKELRGGAK
jgi:hypothetical protein